MALRTVIGQQASYLYTSKMALSEKVEGYYVGIKAGKFGDIIVLQREDGSLVDVFSSGNLKFMRADLKAKGDKLFEGYHTTITKISEYTSKASNKLTGRFLVVQDDTRVKKDLEPMVDSAEATPAAQAPESMEARLKALKSKQA